MSREVCPECGHDACPLWLAWRAGLNGPDEVHAASMRERLSLEHTTVEAPCTACGGAGCNMFFCYAEGA